jgi:hypothetical protein
VDLIQAQLGNNGWVVLQDKTPSVFYKLVETRLDCDLAAIALAAPNHISQLLSRVKLRAKSAFGELIERLGRIAVRLRNESGIRMWTDELRAVFNKLEMEIDELIESSCNRRPAAEWLVKIIGTGAVTTPMSSVLPAEETKTRLESWKKRFENHPLGATAKVGLAIVAALAALLGIYKSVHDVATATAPTHNESPQAGKISP